MRIKEFAPQSVPQPTQPLAQSPLASVLERTAKQAGIVGVELAQLLAQCHVETVGFQTLKELPNKWQQHYEPPSKTAAMLGNVKPGDGQKFLGRGFIQVTGRYNYDQFAKNSGIDVVSNPELLEKPETAAKATVDFWLNRVRPNVKNFADTAKVTKIINHAGKGGAERHKAFSQYASKLPDAQQPKLAAKAKTTQAAAPKGTTTVVKPQSVKPVVPAKPVVKPAVQPQQPKGDLDAFIKQKGLG